MSKRPRSEKGKNSNHLQTPLFLRMHLNRFSVIHDKHVISGRTIVLVDFEYLNLANILYASSLEHLVTMKESVYLELVHFFLL